MSITPTGSAGSKKTLGKKRATNPKPAPKMAAKAKPAAQSKKTKASKIVSYAVIGRKKQDKGYSQIVASAGKLGTLVEKHGQGDWPAVQGNASQDKDDRPRLADVGKGVFHFYQQLKAYYELALAADVIPNIFIGAYFRAALELHAKDNFNKVSEIDGLPVYGMCAADVSYLSKKVKRWNEIEAGFSQLSSSMLLSLVATFDSAFSEFAKALLRAKPQRYTGSDRSYSVSEILALGSVEGLIDKVIDDEVDQIMNKSHTDQISYFEKSFDVKIIGQYPRWPLFIEVFERRNLAAHGDLCINDRYISNCKKSGYDVKGLTVGRRLVVDSNYLESAIDLLIECGVLLAFSAWQKQSPTSIDDTFSAIVEISFSLLTEDHPEVAKRILDYALSVKKKGASDVNVKIMTVNLAIAHKMTDANDEALKVLDTEDWSAANPDFKFCVAAVREDVEEACRLMPLVKAGDQIGAEEVRDWPALQWLRNKPEFLEAAEKVFGEPFGALTEKTGESDDVIQVDEVEAKINATPAE